MDNHEYQPKTKEELIDIIKKEIFEVQAIDDKPNWEANFNHINITLIDGLPFLFSTVHGLEKFNGKIDKWDTSNVKDMEYMFYNNKVFNQDISNWDVSNVKDMNGIFEGCKINIDINKWKLGILLLNLI